LCGSCAEPEPADDTDEPVPEVWWDDIHECDAQTMGVYIEDSRRIVAQYEDLIVTLIDTLDGDEPQLVPPAEVIDLMVSGEVEVLCGTPAEGFTKKGMWSGAEQFVVLNEERFGELYDEHYEPNIGFVGSQFEPDVVAIWTYLMLNQSDQADAWNDVFDGIYNLYYAAFGNGLSQTMLHEHTHAAWDYAGFNPAHPADGYYDPFYTYGDGAHALTDAFWAEIYPELSVLWSEFN